MKKLFSIVAMLLLVFTLTGCSEIDSLRGDLETKANEVKDLVEDVTDLEETIQHVHSVVSTINNNSPISYSFIQRQYLNYKNFKKYFHINQHKYHTFHDET